MKIKRKTIKKRLWSLVSKYIRTKAAVNDYVTCITCGTTKPIKEMQAGHWIPQAKGDALRYEEENIHPQCYRCNVNLSGNAGQYYQYMINFYGKDKMDDMVIRSNQVSKLTTGDLLALEADYKMLYEAL